MPIKRLLRNSKLGPEEIQILSQAFDRALRSLSLVDRDDPLTEMVARKIIEIGAATIRDPIEIAKMAVERVRIS